MLIAVVVCFGIVGAGVSAMTLNASAPSAPDAPSAPVETAPPVTPAPASAGDDVRPAPTCSYRPQIRLVGLRLPVVRTDVELRSGLYRLPPCGGSIPTSADV